MKTYLSYTLSLFIFFLGFGYFFGESYWEYHKDKEAYLEFLGGTEKELQSFIPEEISSFEWNTKLHILPDLDILESFVEKIDTAQEKIYVEVYIFTEKDMRDALIRAHNRWVEVKIILENNPYNLYLLEISPIRSLLKIGI